MKKIYLIVFAVLFLFSCEKVLDDYELPYERKLVIQAILNQGTEENRFSFTLTQPPLGKEVQEEIDPDFLIGHIESEGQRWDLKYYESVGYYERGYYYTEGLIPETGKTYDLYVEYKGLKAFATTTLPKFPKIIDTLVIEEEYDDGWETGTRKSLYCRIIPEPGVVYTNEYEWWSEPVTYADALIDENGNKYLDVFLNEYHYSNSEIVVGIFQVFDEQYYDYIISKKKYNDDVGDIFSTSGTQIDWNIKGDGIGVFFATDAKVIEYSE